MTLVCAWFRACELGLPVFPGVMTPTEAFTALKHGARTVKLFPTQVGRLS
jgi:2-dehydro-3-deoxyphosphogalactonate aldolase